ncbi:hypothetical protein [Gelatiniphilus marinus]|uniref:Uncharacterized protein n=1 Tax=Gelatiniphilus marinus TaxID=1759464 RepID=A0ABW5JQH3_9FLAO
MKNNKNIQIIDKIYKAFAAGDIPTVLGNVASPNIEWNEAEGNR